MVSIATTHENETGLDYILIFPLARYLNIYDMLGRFVQELRISLCVCYNMNESA